MGVVKKRKIKFCIGFRGRGGLRGEISSKLWGWAETIQNLAEGVGVKLYQFRIWGGGGGWSPLHSKSGEWGSVKK